MVFINALSACARAPVFFFVQKSRASWRARGTSAHGVLSARAARAESITERRERERRPPLLGPVERARPLACAGTLTGFAPRAPRCMRVSVSVCGWAREWVRRKGRQHALCGGAAGDEEEGGRGARVSRCDKGPTRGEGVDFGLLFLGGAQGLMW